MNVLYAVALIPMIGVLGLATDTARGFIAKARLSQAIDQAALAGGKVYFSSNRNSDILKYFAANFPTRSAISFGTPFDAKFMDARVTLDTPTESGQAGREILHVSGSATIPTTFVRVLSAFGCTTCDEMTVVAEAQVERTIHALDAVISLDMSGSMDGPDKIGRAREGLVSFMDTVYGPNNNQSPTLEVDGVTYNLINVGLVVWNHKTNVTTNGVTFTGATTETVPSYTNPITLATNQSTVWSANNSEVPLLMDPRDTSAGGQLPGGWSGCVYARYVGGEGTPGSQNSPTGSVNSNDADLVLGPQYGVGSGSTQKDWPAWEPMARYEAEPRQGFWDTPSDGEPPNTRWRNDNNWRAKNCSLAYYTDFAFGNGNTYSTDLRHNLDLANGGIKGAAPDTSRPAWIRAATATPDSHYSGTLRFFNDNTRPYAMPVIGGSPGQSGDCLPCLRRGIIPLTPDKAAIQGQINGITDGEPDGNTNILQGLYWAWEVLMPGKPFDQAVVSTPFQRNRYVILITDGAQFGGNGDAYKGRFGHGEIAGDNVDASHGMITAPVEPTGWQYGDAPPSIVSAHNNLDNRLRQLARNIKDQGIKLYVIGFGLAGNPDELRLLSALASPPDGESASYFTSAETGSDLVNTLERIAIELTNVRLSG